MNNNTITTYIIPIKIDKSSNEPLYNFLKGCIVQYAYSNDIDLSDMQIKELIDIIINDDSLWNDFDYHLNEICNEYFK